MTKTRFKLLTCTNDDLRAPHSCCLAGSPCWSNQNKAGITDVVCMWVICHVINLHFAMNGRWGHTTVHSWKTIFNF